jgi:hypothetical protein
MITSPVVRLNRHCRSENALPSVFSRGCIAYSFVHSSVLLVDRIEDRLVTQNRTTTTAFEREKNEKNLLLCIVPKHRKLVTETALSKEGFRRQHLSFEKPLQFYPFTIKGLFCNKQNNRIACRTYLP